MLREELNLAVRLLIYRGSKIHESKCSASARTYGLRRSYLAWCAHILQHKKTPEAPAPIVFAAVTGLKLGPNWETIAEGCEYGGLGGEGFSYLALGCPKLTLRLS